MPLKRSPAAETRTIGPTAAVRPWRLCASIAGTLGRRGGEVKGGCVAPRRVLNSRHADDVPLRPARPAARGGGPSRRGAGVPARAVQRRQAGDPGQVLGRLRPRVLAPRRRARLDRHDVAQEVRRPRAELPRALRGPRGDARGGRSGERPLGGRPPERPAAAALRHGRAAGEDPARHRARRARLRDRHERARLRLRPRVDPHPGGARRRRLRRQRHQGLDEQRAHLRLLDRALPDADRARQEARGVDAVPRGLEEHEGHHDPPHHRSGGPAPLQRGQLHRRLRARGGPGRERGGRLEAGDDGARLRAERAGALPLEHLAHPGADPRSLGAARRALPRAGGPPRRGPRDAPPDVDVRRRDAPGGGESEPRSGHGEGRRHDLRAVRSRAGARPGRDRADQRDGLPVPAGPRLHHADGAVVLVARRDARDPARHHRARAGAAMTSELGSLLADTVTRLFNDLATKELIESAEKGAWPDKLWRALEEGGLTLPLVPESAGGAAGTWLDAHVVVRASGRHTAPVPLAETIIAGWLLSRAGLEVPLGPLTLAPVHEDERLTLARGGGGFAVSGTATRVPWGRHAGHVVTLSEADGRATIALIPGGRARITEDTNLALEPRDTLVFRDARVVAFGAADVPADAIYLYGAMARAAQMAGALDSCLTQAVRYATERKQFGKPIGNFQAIQQSLAVLAGHVAASGIAAESAFRAAERNDARFEIAVAKVRVGEAAGVGAGIAHQTHGAIGFTYEHSLHFATRRLWSWRAELGSESAWARQLGRAVAARGADALWPMLTERP